MKLPAKRSFIKTFFAMALAAVLCLGGLTTAFAAGTPIEGNAAALKKVLQMPEGTQTPAATFRFTFEKVSLNNESGTDALADMPALAEQSITFSAGDNGNTANRMKTVSKESSDIFAGITWPSPGVYTYTLTETQDTYNIADQKLETMDYSHAEYEINAYVTNGENGPELTSISAVIKQKDDSQDDTVAVGDKVDPTPGSSTMVFTNTYTKISGNGTVANGGLTVSKTVAGDMGSTALYFPFTIKTTAAATQSGTVTYKAYLLEDGAVIDPTADNGSFTTGNDGTNEYIVVTAGTALSINLKHNQKLVFADLPVGARYTATESPTANYAPSINLTANGGASEVGNTTVNVSLSTDEQLIGEGANSAAFINTFDTSITPTGISLNDLPFITMIVLAAGALVLFAVVKSRRRADANHR